MYEIEFFMHFQVQMLDTNNTVIDPVCVFVYMYVCYVCMNVNMQFCFRAIEIVRFLFFDLCLIFKTIYIYFSVFSNISSKAFKTYLPFRNQH